PCLLSITLREKVRKNALTEHAEPRVGAGCEIEMRPFVLPRIAALELVGMRIELGMTIEHRIQQGPARALDLRDKDQRLSNVHDRVSTGREQAFGIVPTREAMAFPAPVAGPCR